MDGAEHQVAGFGRVDGGHERFRIAHFADEHHVGVFADGVLHADAEIDDIEANFALVDQALVFREHEFDRVLERENVLAILMVDQIEHRGDRGAFAGARNAGQQDHALVEMAKFLDGGRQKETAEIGHEAIDSASHQADVSELL